VFDTASISHDVDKATWRREEPKLRQALLEGSSRCWGRRTSPCWCSSAAQGSGKGETVNLLHEVGETSKTSSLPSPKEKQPTKPG
jgi:hypothetical protein